MPKIPDFEGLWALFSRDMNLKIQWKRIFVVASEPTMIFGRVVSKHQLHIELIMDIGCKFTWVINGDMKIIVMWSRRLLIPNNTGRGMGPDDVPHQLIWYLAQQHSW